MGVLGSSGCCSPPQVWAPGSQRHEGAIAAYSQCWLHTKRGPGWSLAVPCGHPLEEVETLSQLWFLSEHLTFCLAVTCT